MLKQPKKPVVVLDVDDTLAECNKYAIKITGQNEKVLYDLDSWKNSIVTSYSHLFREPDFVSSQPEIPGAKEFIDKVRALGCMVRFCTSVPAEVASERIFWLCSHFNVSSKDVIITSHKELIKCDILVDDAPHNILESIAAYPILFRRPWNKDITGMLAVNNYEELLNMIETIIVKKKPVEDPDFICLVAPSGSGKTETIEEMMKAGYSVPEILTVRQNASAPYYRKISKSEFNAMISRNEFVETSAYAGELYGITKESVCNAVQNGKVVIPIDLCGANAIKHAFPDKVVTVYIRRNKTEIIEDILKKNVETRCKTLRILALDAEEKNAELCDYETDFVDAKDCANEIIRTFK